MKKIDLLAKAGRPCSPGEGFQGVVELDGTFTEYQRIDQFMARWQLERGIIGTNDQWREAQRQLRRAA